jgi:hypothetical protein
MNGCQTKIICPRAMKFHLKQQYTILFQGNFISEVYLLQEKSYLTFYTGQDFWRALYLVWLSGCRGPSKDNIILTHYL